MKSIYKIDAQKHLSNARDNVLQMTNPLLDDDARTRAAQMAITNLSQAIQELIDYEP